MKALALALVVGLQTAAAAAQPAVLDCAYAPRGGEMQTFHGCASKDAEGQIHLQRQHLARLAYDRTGLTSVYVGGWYYLARDGSSAAVMAFDNGPDPFAEGLARAVVGSKIGYIDRHLRLVIPARFDGAFPFERGKAAVCVGCRTMAEGEHSSYAGGHWGCIDRRGVLVTALHDADGYTPC